LKGKSIKYNLGPSEKEIQVKHSRNLKFQSKILTVIASGTVTLLHKHIPKSTLSVPPLSPHADAHECAAGTAHVRSDAILASSLAHRTSTIASHDAGALPK